MTKTEWDGRREDSKQKLWKREAGPRQAPRTCPALSDHSLVCSVGVYRVPTIARHAEHRLPAREPGAPDPGGILHAWPGCVPPCLCSRGLTCEAEGRVVSFCSSLGQAVRSCTQRGQHWFGSGRPQDLCPPPPAALDGGEDMTTLPHDRAEASPARTLPASTPLGAPEALAQEAGAAALGGWRRGRWPVSPGREQA